MTGFRVIPLPCAAEVRAGDDLATLLEQALRDAGVTLHDADVVCVASKVVAKAEGRLVPLPAGDPDHARRTLARDVAARIVADTPYVLVVETEHGFVSASAGIDASNVVDDPTHPHGSALLLPSDPDAAAATLRGTVAERLGADIGVVVTDTFGRPWRLGQVDVALGAAGVVALRDDRGTTDRDGRPLAVSMVAVADQLAAAADLARAKADGTPFVLVRGLDVAGSGTGADLVRPAGQDVFRHGGVTAVEVALDRARTALVEGAARDGDAAADGPLLDRLAETARGAALAVDVAVEQGRLLLRGPDPVAHGTALQAVAVLAGALGITIRASPTAHGLQIELVRP